MADMDMSKNRDREDKTSDRPRTPANIKFEVYGEEIIDKSVSRSGPGGRVYCPIDWVDKRVKIIRIEHKK